MKIFSLIFATTDFLTLLILNKKYYRRDSA